MTSNPERLFTVAQWCTTALEELVGTGLTGVTLSRIGAGGVVGVVYASDDLGEAVLAVHETVIEGPLNAAMRSRGPVFTSDLTSSHTPASWLPYVTEVTALGVRSLLVFPVQIGAIMLGLLSVHGPEVATVPVDRLARLILIADELAGVLLAPPPERERASWEQGLLDTRHAVVHQATGMVMVQLDCNVEDAISALRARAYAEGTTPLELARRIVRREQRLTTPNQAGGPPGTGHPDNDNRDDSPRPTHQKEGSEDE